MAMRAPLFTSLAMLTLVTASVACPVAPPAGLQGFTVSQQLHVNGLPTAIYQVRSADSAERILVQTEREWKAQGYAPQRHTQSPWRIISAASADCITALQLQDSVGSHGFLSVTRPQHAMDPVDQSTQQLMPAGTTTTSAVRSNDHGRDGLTLIIQAPLTQAKWGDALVQQLERKHWQQVSRREVAMPTGHVPGERITALSKGRQFTAMVWGGKRTEAVITVVEPL